MAKATTKKTTENKEVQKAPPLNEVSTDDVSVGVALSKGWNMLVADKSIWAQFALVMAIPSVLLSFLLGKALDTDGLESLSLDPAAFTKLAGGALLVALVTSIYSLIVSAILVQASLKNAEGTRPKSLSHIFDMGKDKLMVVALMMIIVFVIIGIGMFFLIIPGIIAAFLFAYSVFIVADTSMGVGDALKLSMKYASKYYSPMLFLALALFGVSIITTIVLSLLGFLPQLLESLIGATVQAGVQIFGVLAAAVLYLEIKKRLGDGTSTTQE